MTAQQLHALMPGDRVRTTRRFTGRNTTIPKGTSGLVQVVIVELHLGDRQEVGAVEIKWRGREIETLQAKELKRWTVCMKKRNGHARR